jgi:putative tryptophan/tyrosine transport system substrate-binding protein
VHWSKEASSYRCAFPFWFRVTVGTFYVRRKGHPPSGFDLSSTDLRPSARSLSSSGVKTQRPSSGGFVESMARPGGNSTGFIAFEYAIGAKWLELLKEVVPHVTRAAVLRDSTIAAGIGQFAAIQATATRGIDLSAVGLQDAGAIEPAVAAFARIPNGGLVVTASPFAGNYPALIVALAARYKLPAVYPFRLFVSAGGLMSYGPDLVSQSRPAAEYVDRILKGENPPICQCRRPPSTSW